MAVYEIMEKNLLNDTEYFIGLPTFDIQDQESLATKPVAKRQGYSPVSLEAVEGAGGITF